MGPVPERPRVGHGARGLLADGSAWEYFPHEHARSRAYRWSEDGLGGICDRQQLICFAVALWNGRDPILKERLFGLTGNEGQPRRGRQGVLLLPGLHADALLHEVPLQVSAGGFPYDALRRRKPAAQPRTMREYELLDTGVFDDDRYFDVFVEYAKASAEDILIRITRRQPRPGRGRRSTCCRRSGFATRGRGEWTRGTRASRLAQPRDDAAVDSREPLRARPTAGCCARARPSCCSPRTRRTSSGSSAAENATPYVKDGINDYVVDGRGGGRQPGAARHQGGGPLSAARSRPASTATVRLRLGEQPSDAGDRGADDEPFGRRRSTRVVRRAHPRSRRVLRERSRPAGLAEDARRVQRQALRGSAVEQAVLPLRRPALAATATRPARAAATSARAAATASWTHLYNADVISMPDKWEYPVVRRLGPGVPLHPARARRSGLRQGAARCSCCANGTCIRTGSCPPTSGRFGDVNPPVHAWAAWRVYKIEQKRRGRGRPRVPRARLPQAAAQLHVVGEPQGRRGQERLPGRLPRPRQHRRLRPQRAAADRRHIEQSDGTSWMGMYCLNMLAIALELAQREPGVRGRRVEVLRALRLHRAAR